MFHFYHFAICSILFVFLPDLLTTFLSANKRFIRAFCDKADIIKVCRGVHELIKCAKKKKLSGGVVGNKIKK